MDFKKVVPWVLAFVTLNSILGAALYSLIGETDNYGNFKINRFHQFILIVITLALVVATIKTFRCRNK
ncbi:hypothetical protein BVY00_00605 [bacterium G20]|nr:hypothetical protein BVY00_00605 [bacterium G20]